MLWIVGITICLFIFVLLLAIYFDTRDEDTIPGILFSGLIAIGLFFSLHGENKDLYYLVMRQPITECFDKINYNGQEHNLELVETLRDIEIDGVRFEMTMYEYNRIKSRVDRSCNKVDNIFKELGARRLIDESIQTELDKEENEANIEVNTEYDNW
jgi:hypothetical protein